MLYSIQIHSIVIFFLCTQLSILPTDYMYVPAESFYFVMEGTTTEVSFALLNPPAVGDGFEFDFNVVMSSEDGEAIGQLR